MKFKKELVIIGLLFLFVLPLTFTQVQAAKPPQAQSPKFDSGVTLTSPNPIGANYDWDIMGGRYGSYVAAAGGYTFVSELNTIYVYNERNNRLVKTFEGSSVATGGGYLAITDPGYWPDGSSKNGKVDVYSLSDLGTIVATITSPADDYFQNFGLSVAISGSQLIISDSGSSETSWVGDVYIYSVPSFEYEATLEQQYPEYSPDAPFGYNVALSGEHIVVSAPMQTVNGLHSSGRVYVYSSTTYTLETTISNPDASEPYALPGGKFGWSIAVAQHNIWIGEPGYGYPTEDNPDGTYAAGIAYCYNTDGTQIAVIESENPTLEGYFGKSIAANSEYVIVGAPGESVDVNSETILYSAGKAYVFDTSGTYVKTLISLNPEAGGSFGQSVAIGAKYVVGAPNEDVTLRYRTAPRTYTTETFIDAGHAYIFR